MTMTSYHHFHSSPKSKTTLFEALSHAAVEPSLSTGDGGGRRRRATAVVGGGGGGGGGSNGDGDSDSDSGGGGGRENSGGGGNRYAARNHRNGDGEEVYDGRMVWVNMKSTPQTVARSITGAAMLSARNGFPVYVFSKYDKNSNTAIKGVVSAQHILQERRGITIAFKPTFRGNRNELTLKVEKVIHAPHLVDSSILDGAQQLSVASGTDPKVMSAMSHSMALSVR